MNKPIIFNRTLYKKWNEKDNDYMIHKLNEVKSKVDKKCPESFTFYKTQFTKASTRTNKLREYEIRKNNEVLVEKIMNVFINKEKKRNEQPKPTTKRIGLTGVRKYEIIKIAEDNQHMLKRMNERTSFYNVRHWEDQYEKTQDYKKNICMFPSIPFHKRGATAHTTRHSKRPSELEKHEIHLPEFEKENHTLCCKLIHLGDLQQCMAVFGVRQKIFVMQIEKLTSPSKIYMFYFTQEEMSQIQKGFAIYEDILDYLTYESEKDTIKIEKDDAMFVKFANEVY